MTERFKRIRQEITGVVSILGGVYITLSLATYSEWDSSLLVFTTLPTQNYGGIVGSYIADFLVSGVGLTAFAIPLALGVYGVKRLLGREGHRVYILGFVLFVLSSSMLLSLITATFNLAIAVKGGGFAGLTLSGMSQALLSLPGAYILALALFLSSVIILSPVSIISIIMSGAERKKEETETASDGPVIITDHSSTPVQLEISMPEESEQLYEIESEALQKAVPFDRYRGRRGGGYKLPGIDFLNPPDAVSSKPTEDELKSSSDLLEKKLRDFDVEGKVVNIYPGSVVTMYEYELAPGVKISRVVSLSDDLALSLKAQSVRVCTLPGKAAIGIEVPNKNRETVYLREIISSEVFRKSPSKLALALGKNIFGVPIITDLARMPHLLVAGATGSGKSVSINSMVMSILYKAAPDEVKMLMIDPKLLELSAYEKIPHLISPVITGPKEAAEALRKMVFEMERRYRLLAEKGVRNIEGFNRMVPDEEMLPYIIVFIDELADLMFASANEVEDSIARLAQMARASGIHLILATQRPSVDVITGVIKANFPARIAFQVTSRIDSRTIIDGQGAEQLLGKGDMLLMLPGERITRIHGALITEEEVKRVTDFIRSQGSPDYSAFEGINIEEPAQGDLSAERDEMYQKVLEFAELTGEISISSVQRRFRIGYNKAARIMELMIEDGLVGHSKGAGKPRDFIGRRK
jgi:S-DNA-T family DNA segregation ATPase FtsK/SpoIIIE